MMKRTRGADASANKRTGEPLYIAFDIETTGAKRTSDVCFAVGFCAGYEDGTVVEQGKWVIDLLRKRQREVFVEQPATEETKSEWRALWELNDYEMRCFDEFWSANLEKLIDLMNLADYTDESFIAYQLNRMMAWYEKEYETIVPVFDTVGYDSGWLAYLMTKNDFAPLNAKRDWTGYRTSYELDSYRLGKLGMTPSTPDDKRQAGFAVLESPNIMVNDAHDPEVDAYNIFLNFTHAFAYERKYDIPN